jgi:hypothetical protein
MNITNKQRWKFLNKNKNISLRFNGRRKKFELRTSSYRDSDHFWGDSYEEAIDSAIMKEKESGNNG